MGADLYGGVCVNVLRHPAWGRAQETYGEDPHHLGELGAALTRGAQRHVMATRQALRLQLDGERPLPGRRHRRRPGAARGVPPALQADRRRGRRLRDERLQRRQRRVVRREPRAPHRRAPRRVGLRRLRDQRLDLRPARRRAVRHRGARRGDAGPHDPARRASTTALAEGTVADADVGRASPARSPPCSATPTDPGAIDPRSPPTCSPRPPTAPWPARPPPRRSCCSATSPSTGRPLLPLDPAALRRVAVLGAPRRRAQPRRRRLERRLRPRRRHPPRRACGPALPHAEVVHARRRRPDAAAALAAPPTSPSWWSATPAPTRASSSATSAPPHLQLAPPRADEPDVVAAFEARLRRRPRAAPTARSRAATRSASPPAATASALTLHDADEALIAAVAAANPRTVVAIVAGSAVLMEAWREQVPAHRAGLVLRAWRAATRSPTCCSGTSTRPAGCPFTVPTDEAHLPPFDRDADAVTYDGWHGYWRLARDRHERRLPVRLRPLVHDVGARADHGRRRGRRRSSCAPCSATPATATAPTWCRSTPGGPPTPPARPAAWSAFARVERPRRQPRRRRAAHPVEPAGGARRATRTLGRSCPGTYLLTIGRHAPTWSPST